MFFLSLVLFLTETVWCLISLLVSNVRDEGSEITKYKQILTTVVLSKKKKINSEIVQNYFIGSALISNSV